MSDNTLAGDDTDSSLNTNQVTEKTYTQKEVDDMMARTKSAVQKKVASKYEDLGDPEELRQLKADYEQRKLEEQKKRGEFDSIIANLAAKKDEEIQNRFGENHQGIQCLGWEQLRLMAAKFSIFPNIFR